MASQIENGLLNGKFMKKKKTSLLLKKQQTDSHRDHPSIHHKKLEDTEQMQFLFHFWNQEAGTLHDEQLVDCSRTYRSPRSA